MLTSLRGSRRTLVVVLTIAALLVGGALIAVSALSIGADALHPTDTGHAYLATKMMPVVRTALRD